VEILWILGGLNVALFFATFCCAKSFIEKARRRGMEEATRELSKGFNSHFELEGQAVPERVSIALKRLKEASSITWKPRAGLTEPYHAQLWVLGDAMGEACWIKGHAAGVRRKAPAAGKVRVDFSLNELLQLSWLAHLGFQHMMPNYRGFEIHRFRVVAFNTLEQWSQDVSEYVAFEIQTRCDIQGNHVPDHIRGFVEERTRGARQLSLRVV